MSYQLTKRGFHHDVNQNPKYTHRDWTYNNQLKSRISCDQQKFADRVICEAERVIDETKETTTKFKKETDYRLEERVSHIAFTVDELREQKKLGEREQEILKVCFHDDLLIFFFFSIFCSILLLTCIAHLLFIYHYFFCLIGHKKSNRMCNRIHQD